MIKDPGPDGGKQTCYSRLAQVNFNDLHYKAIVLLEAEATQFRTSRRFEFDAQTDKFPIVSIHWQDWSNKHKEMEKIITDGDSKVVVNFIFGSLDAVFGSEEKQNEDKRLMEVNCDRIPTDDQNNCVQVHIEYPTEKEKIYFGCDGEYKMTANVTISCKYHGLDCPELNTFKTKMQEEKKSNDYKNDKHPLEKCFNSRTIKDEIPLPPANCRRLPKKPCDEKAFWVYDNINNKDGYKFNGEYACINMGEDKILRTKYWRGEICPKEEPDCRMWGNPTIKFNHKTGCKSNNDPAELYRFCRPEKAENCVLVEVERFFKPRNVSDCRNADVETCCVSNGEADITFLGENGGISKPCEKETYY